jgi:branched-chain amino acid transport system ATP-binding protein
MLRIDNLQVRYGAVSALRGINISVAEGQIVTLIGANGAGKSTTLRAISGLVKAVGGSIHFDSHDITNMPPHKIVAAGISHAPEGRMIFANLTTRENLEMGAYLRTDKAEIERDMEFLFSMFPKLKERIKQPGGKLSGGEQQMLAIGRALMTNPRLLILDEATEGLAPLIREEIWRCLARLKSRGQAILVIDKNVEALTQIADRHYLIERGCVVWQGTSGELAAAPDIQHRYLGI